MIICPKCEHPNREGALLCEDCGSPLDKNIKYQTVPIKAELPSLYDEAFTKDLQGDEPSFDSGEIDVGASLFLEIIETSMQVPLERKSRILFGRANVGGSEKVDIDLTDYGGHEMGVSRVHAALERSEDTIILIDLGSTNGTYVNGSQLASNMPKILREGDEIRFGKLVTRILARKSGF